MRGVLKPELPAGELILLMRTFLTGFGFAVAPFTTAHSLIPREMSEKAHIIASTMRFPTDCVTTSQFLLHSRGNFMVLGQYLRLHTMRHMARFVRDDDLGLEIHRSTIQGHVPPMQF